MENWTKSLKPTRRLWVLLTVLSLGFSLGCANLAGKSAQPADSWEPLKILAINDFHGQLGPGKKVGDRAAGSAGVLASYLKAARQGMEDRTFIVSDGDLVGASPAASALLQDEPAILFMNQLANRHCTGGDAKDPAAGGRLDPRCNLVATLGNHEFDGGREELLRLITGGNHPNGPFLEDPYRGALYPYVCANVVDLRTGTPFLPPYVIKKMAEVPVAFIGAVVKETPGIVAPSGVAGLAFLDEAESVNRYIPEIRAKGVRAIVVLFHQGGFQDPAYSGPTRPDGAVVGDIAGIVARLDDEVDVVVSGHAHSFTNALLKNRNGKEILVTQAFSAGTAFAHIDLRIDRRTKDVVKKSASIVITYADEGPGLAPDAAAGELFKAAEAKVGPLVNRVVGEAQGNIQQAPNAAGQSPLGNLVADAQRAAMETDFAFVNPGGIRAEIPQGPVTWGTLFASQPFRNQLVRMKLTGQQIYDLLNQQWTDQQFPRFLQISGLSYTWDNSLPVGLRVVEVRKGGVPLDRSAVYSAAANAFLADGGDRFMVFKQGTGRVMGSYDLDALLAFIGKLPQPFTAPGDQRIFRVN